MRSESSLDSPKFELVGSFPFPSIYFLPYHRLCLPGDAAQAFTSPGIPGRRRPCGEEKVASSIHWKTRFTWGVFRHRVLYGFIGTGVTCSADLGSVSSAFILCSSLHSKQLFFIFNTQPSLLDPYFSHGGTIPPLVLLLQLFLFSQPLYLASEEGLTNPGIRFLCS